MTLPKAKKKKRIDEKTFLRVAKKVRLSFKEEAEYLQKRRAKYGKDSNIFDVPNFY